MTKTVPPWLDLWATAPSWSIPEAAYLVNGIEPPKPIVIPSIEPTEALDESMIRVSQIYVWLTKEFNAGRLTVVRGEGDDARFSPGSLMRRLKERRKFKVWPTIWRAHNWPSYDGARARRYYRRAAELVLEQNPTATITAVACHLSDLHKVYEMHAGKCPFRSKAEDSIRRYLKGLGDSKGGRPSKATSVQELLCIESIALKLIKETGLSAATPHYY